MNVLIFVSIQVIPVKGATGIEPVLDKMCLKKFVALPIKLYTREGGGGRKIDYEEPPPMANVIS